ncbi:MAG: DUF2203 domain-containing protein [Acidobacteria bacterium]|nr:DUF2203 domain-containing protein [Acidobacteriota bacterium]
MSEEIFDLGRAERLLPQLEPLLRAALEEKKRLTSFGKELARQIERIIVLGGSQVDLEHFARCKKGKDESGARLRQAAEEIETLGCHLKDLDIGLVDFPCRLGEREVYLCWKLGEPNIQYWHYVEEGFAGRKPLDERTVKQMQRSCPHEPAG